MIVFDCVIYVDEIFSLRVLCIFSFDNDCNYLFIGSILLLNGMCIFSFDNDYNYLFIGICSILLLNGMFNLLEINYKYV